MAESDSMGQQIVAAIVDKARTYSKDVATRIGQPIDADSLSHAEAVALWKLPNPQADPVQVQTLLQQGRTSEAVDLAYPWRNKLIGLGSPTSRVDRAERLAGLAAQQEDQSNG